MMLLSELISQLPPNVCHPDEAQSVANVNEILQNLRDDIYMQFPGEFRKNYTIPLVDGQQEYSLPTDLYEIINVNGDGCRVKLSEGYNDCSCLKDFQYQVNCGQITVPEDRNYEELTITYWKDIEELTSSSDELPFCDRVAKRLKNVIKHYMSYLTFRYDGEDDLAAISYQLYQDAYRATFEPQVISFC